MPAPRKSGFASCRHNAFGDFKSFDALPASLTVVRGSSKLIVSIAHGIRCDGAARANALATNRTRRPDFEGGPRFALGDNT